MGELKPSDGPASRLRRAAPDVFVALGVVAVTSGAWLFHPAAGLILLGAALVLIGTRGSAPPKG